MPYVTGIGLAANQDGRLELLAHIGPNGPCGLPGGVWHAWQTAPNGDWTVWDSLGQPKRSLQQRTRRRTERRRLP
jgi:hypothetical protein